MADLSTAKRRVLDAAGRPAPVERQAGVDPCERVDAARACALLLRTAGPA